MAVATFDTLKFANTLKAAGVPDRQAEAQAVAFAEVIQINLKDLVTKEDLGLAVGELKREIREVAETSERNLKLEVADLKRDIAELARQTSSDAKTAAAKSQGDMALLRWMFGAMITICVAVGIRLFFFRAF